MEVSEASLSSSINENPFEWNVLKVRLWTPRNDPSQWGILISYHMLLLGKKRCPCWRVFPISGGVLSDTKFDMMFVFSQDYLQGQSKTVKDMLRECISRLDSGQHHCSGLPVWCKGKWQVWLVKPSVTQNTYIMLAWGIAGLNLYGLHLD